MKIYKHCIFIVISAVAILAYLNMGSIASSKEKHFIDKWVEEQIAKDPSTAGEIQAYAKGSDMWDKELNKVYRELMNKLDNNQRVALQEAQINWIKFRDADHKAINLIIQGLEGTMWLPVPEARLYKIIPQRAMELKDYLEWTELYSRTH